MKNKFMKIGKDSIARAVLKEVREEDLRKIEESCTENDAQIIFYRNRFQIKHGDEPDYYGQIAKGKLENPMHFADWLLSKIDTACMYDGLTKWNLPHERVLNGTKRA